MNPGWEIGFGAVKCLGEAIGVGIELSEKCLEFCAVVHMDGVAELMNDHMPEEIGREKEQWGVE